MTDGFGGREGRSRPDAGRSGGSLPTLHHLESFVRQTLTPQRFAHVQGVVETAQQLASRHGVDVQKCLVASWLHDVAKEYDRDESLKLAGQFGIIFSELERHAPALWHARLGAEIARRRFGVTDGEVLAAIRYHTTGRPGMSSVERVVFLADLIEPGRTFAGVERLRELSRRDLRVALLAALDGNVKHVVESGRLLHPDAVAARNELLLELM